MKKIMKKMKKLMMNTKIKLIKKISLILMKNIWKKKLKKKLMKKKKK